MAIYGVSFTLNYVAWDTTNNVGKTGDAANHTLRWIKDGTAAAPTNSPVEVDAANAPGIYSLTLTATEAQATYGTLAGKSSTSGVSIMPVSIAFERLPNAAPGSSGGLPILDANGRIKADAEAISGSVTAADTLEAKIANLDVAVSSRLATTSYVAPDNTSITAIKAQTDKLQFDASNRIIADAQAISASTTAADTLEANIANLDVAVSTRLATTAYTAPPSEADIWSYATRTLTAFAFPVTVATNNDKTGYSLTADYDRAKTALATTEYTSPDNASIAAIKAQTDRLQFDANDRVLADATATVDVGAIADAVWDEPRSQHIISGSFGAVAEWASANAGTGARTITVTVDDGAGPLESATVRATKGAETYTAKTNVAGQATFYLDDGTWTFVVTLAGYNGASAIHIADAAQSPLTISLSQLNISPSPPGTITGYAVVLDQYGAIEPGVTCSAQLVYTPSGSGVVGDVAAQVRTSDANGVVQFTGLLPGGTYKFSRGEQFILVAVPTNAPDPWQIPNFGGAP